MKKSYDKKIDVSTIIVKVLITAGTIIDGFFLIIVNIALAPFNSSRTGSSLNSYVLGSRIGDNVAGSAHIAYTPRVLFGAFRGIYLTFAIPAYAIDLGINGDMTAVGACLYTAGMIAFYFLYLRPAALRISASQSNNAMSNQYRTEQNTDDDIEEALPYAEDQIDRERWENAEKYQ